MIFIILLQQFQEKKGKVKCIPNNEEKYVSFSNFIPVEEKEKRKIYHEIRFLDLMKFQAFSLDALVTNLEKDQLFHTKNIFGEKANLLSRKGVYPYEWMDSFEKFTKQLPPKKAFFSQLNETEISEEDFQHARNIWILFQMKTMQEFHGLYLKTDTILLADVFENFRKTCLETYKLEPCWYLTTQSFAWDCFLKVSKVEMKLLMDQEMHLFFEN